MNTNKCAVALMLLLTIVATTSWAQSVEKCAYPQLLRHKQEQDPTYQSRVDRVFEEAKAWSATHKSAEDEVYRIPVVVHVVYTNNESNIPDSVVHSQIDALNRDFRRRNADTVLTRTEFKGLGVDTKIEFYLAKVDPNGDPTNGITRTAGSPTFGFIPQMENVKHSDQGGKDCWPTDKYLNIWVCDILFGFGVLGYAYPPDNALNWDSLTTDSADVGVVIHYPVFGMNNPSNTGAFADVKLGRSCVHEVGHYLGLRHIWGDGDCTYDDGLEDTPFAATATDFVCDQNKNTCTDTPVDLPDMMENFMDYSIDSCLNLFTKDQADIMRGVMAIARNGLVTWDEPDPPVGVAKQPVPLGLQVIPNPSNGVFRVQLSTAVAITYRVTNIWGATVAAGSNANKVVQLDLASHPNGLYLLEMSDGKTVWTEKLLLSR